MDNNAGLAFLFFVFIIIIIWFFSMSGSVRERKFMFREGLENQSNRPWWKTSKDSHKPWMNCLKTNNCTQKDVMDQVKYYTTGKYSNSYCNGTMMNPQTKKLCPINDSLFFCPKNSAKECIMFNEINAPGKYGMGKNTEVEEEERKYTCSGEAPVIKAQNFSLKPNKLKEVINFYKEFIPIEKKYEKKYKKNYDKYFTDKFPFTDLIMNCQEEGE